MNSKNISKEKVISLINESIQPPGTGLLEKCALILDISADITTLLVDSDELDHFDGQKIIASIGKENDAIFKHSEAIASEEWASIFYTQLDTYINSMTEIQADGLDYNWAPWVNAIHRAKNHLPEQFTQLYSGMVQYVIGTWQRNLAGKSQIPKEAVEQLIQAYQREDRGFSMSRELAIYNTCPITMAIGNFLNINSESTLELLKNLKNTIFKILKEENENFLKLNTTKKMALQFKKQQADLVWQIITKNPALWNSLAESEIPLDLTYSPRFLHFIAQTVNKHISGQSDSLDKALKKLNEINKEHPETLKNFLNKENQIYADSKTMSNYHFTKDYFPDEIIGKINIYYIIQNLSDEKWQTNMKTYNRQLLNEAISLLEHLVISLELDVDVNFNQNKPKTKLNKL